MHDKDGILPDWLGSGEDLFATIQIIQGKNISIGFLEIDHNFKFSAEFNYPVILTLKSISADIACDTVAFRIEGVTPDKRLIEESFVAPSVVRTLTHQDLVSFFAEIVVKDVTFALFLNKRPRRFRDLRFWPLTETQKIVLNEHFVFEIMEVLDQQRAVQALNTDADESLFV